MTQRLDLSVRSLARPSSSAFDTRPRAVTRWAADLPIANLDETAQRLRHALAEVNGLAIPVSRRFHLLETFGPKAKLALDHLRRRYANQPLPLSTSADGAARQAIELLAELLRGYRTLLGQLITDGKAPSRWRRLWFRKPLNGTLHRFIHYGGELLTVYRAMHREAPDGLWKRVNRCYLLAELHNMARNRLPLPGDTRHRSRMSEEYLRLLLLALLPADGLSPAQWNEVGDNLPRWLARTALVPPPLTPGQQVHVVRLGRDSAPVAAAVLDKEALASPHTRGIRITALRAELEARLARDGRGRFWRREAAVSPGTLQFLLDNWCSEHQRTERRDMRECRAEVIIGLAALNHLLRGDAPEQEQVPPTTPAHPPITLAPDPEDAGHHVGARAGGVDVWQSVYVDPDKVCPVEPAAQDWRTQTRAGDAYRPLPARLTDRSDHGCCVRAEKSAVQNVATGMLVAVRAEEDAIWRMGVIARVTAQGEEVELGMKMVGEAPSPAVLHTRSARGISTFPAVLGHDDKGRRLLIAPAVPAVREGELVVELGGQRVPIKRLGDGAQTRHVTLYAIAPLRPDDEHHLAQRPAAEVAVELPRAEPPATSPESQAVEPPAVPANGRVEKLMAATGMSREDAEFFLAAEAAHQTDSPPRLKAGDR